MSGLRQVVMTRCPVGGASEIALRKGYLKRAFDELDAELIMLQSLPKEEQVRHYTQEAPLTFRDGGNVPPIWSHSKGTKTKVIAMSAIRQSHAIIVAPDSGITEVLQLRGKRLSVPDFCDIPIDFLKAMTLRGYQTILRGYGIRESEVSFVTTKGSLAKSRIHVDENGRPVEDTKAVTEDYVSEHIDDLKALKEGRIDAFFSHRSLVSQIVSKGLGRVLIDIADTELPLVNNIYPNVITVDEEFAKENGDIVTAYLKQLFYAADWAEKNREESLAISAGGQYGATVTDVKKSRQGKGGSDLRPGLTPQLIEMLKDQKDFLSERGFLAGDFSVEDWIDGSFLEEAKREYEQETQSQGY